MNRNKLIRNIAFGFLLLLISSCTEVIDIELDPSQIRLVVDGAITNEPGPHQIRLTSSADYFHNELPPAISGANVTLETEDSIIQLVEQATANGIYETPSGFQGEKGKEYQLKIHLAEPLGEMSDFSATDKIPSTVYTIDSIGLVYEPLWEFWSVNLYAFEPPTTDFYKADILINGRMMTDTANRSFVTDDRFINGNYSNGATMLFLRGTEVNVGDTITLILSSITESYFNFFIELQSESGISTPLFSGPPANISTNIEPGGLGYFSARSVERCSRVVKPEDYLDH
jgi:hypothetical protein